MNILLYFIGPLVVAIIIHPLMSVMYKDVEKKDKGFVLNYHKLTYRRKLIRSLWNIPFVLLLYLAIYWLAGLTTNELKIIGIVFFSLTLLDIVYHYTKWKMNDRSSNLL